MFKLVVLIVSGFVYFYIEIVGIQGKFVIVYRDLKSKNILVKRNGEGMFLYVNLFFIFMLVGLLFVVFIAKYY